MGWMIKEKTIKTWQGIAICTTASTFCTFQYIIQVLPSIMTEEWMRDFQISASGISSLSSIFFIFYVGWQMPAGKLINRFGPSRILTLMMSVCALSNWALYLFPSYTMAMITRACLGTATAFCISGTYFLISHWFALRWFSFLAGMVQIACCIGAIFSQTFISYWIYYIGWRQIHVYLSLVGCVLALLYFFILRDNPLKNNKIKPSKKTTHRPGSGTFGLLNRRLLLLTCYALTVWVPVTILASMWGIPFLCNVYGLEKTLAAKAISWIWIGIAIGSPLYGLLAGYALDKTKFFVYSSFIALVSTALFVTTPLPWVVNQLMLFLIGLCAGVLPICFAHLYDFIPQQKMGETIGFLNMAPCLSGAIFQPVLAYLLLAQWDGTYFNSIPYHSAQDYKQAMLLIPACGVISLILAFRLRKQSRQPFGKLNQKSALSH